MTSITDRSGQTLCAVLPAFNEGDNLSDVVEELSKVLETYGWHWRILVVDDGSTDDTPEVMETLIGRYGPDRVSTLRLKRNRGKSAALQVAFDDIRDDLVLLMDADGQDDPNELGALLAALDEGHDLVTGRREIRQDRFVKRNTSKVYNRTTELVSGVEGRDFNSGFKLMRGDVARSLEMYGELHRYIPVMANWLGYRVTEADVNHRDRLHGDSKFGRNRFWRGLLDLFTVKFLTTYDTRPFHLIGGAGLGISFLGSLLLLWMLVLRVAGQAVGNRPALLAGVTLAVLGVQLVSVGLLAELIVFLHHRSARDEDVS